MRTTHLRCVNLLSCWVVGLKTGIALPPLRAQLDIDEVTATKSNPRCIAGKTDRPAGHAAAGTAGAATTVLEAQLFRMFPKKRNSGTGMEAACCEVGAAGAGAGAGAARQVASAVAATVACIRASDRRSSAISCW